MKSIMRLVLAVLTFLFIAWYVTKPEEASYAFTKGECRILSHTQERIYRDYDSAKVSADKDQRKEKAIQHFNSTMPEGDMKKALLTFIDHVYDDNLEQRLPKGLIQKEEYAKCIDKWLVEHKTNYQLMD